MPEICRFYGIVIKMYFDDHYPPHFHAQYAGQEVLIDVGPRDPGPVTRAGAWIETLHQAELEEVWRQMRNQQPPVKINPLP